MDDDDSHGLMGTSGQGYSWEEEYKRSWDILQEDEQGSLVGAVNSIQQQLKRRRLQRDTATVQRGIIRHVYLVIDLSRAMTELDLKPSRLECTMNLATQFVGEYFDQNPLSQLGVILTRDALAEKVTELSGNPTDHIEAIKVPANRVPKGEPSLQNALELARTSLAHVPSHASREIIILYASLTSCDPDNIQETIASLKRDEIRVSIVGLSAELQVCKIICKETKGTYNVILNEAHYKDVLFEHIPPPPIAVEQNTSSLIQMGFPVTKSYETLTLCACHHRPVRKGYECPRCASLICDIPTDCPICDLTLVSSPLLARSYHHLFPVENYKELPWSAKLGPDTATARNDHCAACLLPFPAPPQFSGPERRSSEIPTRQGDGAASGEANSGRFECGKCKGVFCWDCDVYVHDVLHNCPGCVNR
ncbi:Ssl1-like-domain-containing protein [Fimicolochytrium jonesii]|uniref:Ssl1-like-domain-containing protein n=1 Tax=Fimicolochytrium jonesii TaxID=1396493 RepID=UPI0022FEFBA7|nr:Ssl1-like-domain-containing protein [Fimicolochytrium jonesii]KAI8821039.1 Ssl1-like-domain-containing protein [Fimicolochytrium jonesii]